MCASERRFLVRSPGFEPGCSAWEAEVLTKFSDCGVACYPESLDYDRIDVMVVELTLKSLRCLPLSLKAFRHV